MLKFLGMNSIEQLMDETVPHELRINKQEMFSHGTNKIYGVDSGNIVSRHMLKLSEANKIHRNY
jgi:glycine cleavage system pyridoxal-binding protein P